jgi:hypothetical protein
MTATVSFCGEEFPVTTDSPVSIGREGTLQIDDNPYLHRRFLEVTARDDLIWLSNVGSATSATVADEDGLVQTWLAPGAQVPLVFPKTVVWFTAGPTTYEFEVHVQEPKFSPIVDVEASDGETTRGRMSFTPDQRLLIVALAEEILRRGRGQGTVPPSRDAAARLGWTITKFNRKLDNVCDKLTRLGVRGLHGSVDKTASNRRVRLVEYALASRLVTSDDLALLDLPTREVT